jgi:hypothetical protein
VEQQSRAHISVGGQRAVEERSTQSSFPSVPPSLKSKKRSTDVVHGGGSLAPTTAGGRVPFPTAHIIGRAQSGGSRIRGLKLSHKIFSFAIKK